jgi:DNA-binding response OmpR family regulator
MREHEKPKVLIVDDDDSLRQIYARYLSAEGFQVAQASNGEQALLDFQDSRLDAILLDIRMPVANGQVLMPALQKSHPHAHIIISSCYDLDFQKEMIGGADSYFNKAEGCRALLGKLKAVLAKHPGNPAVR